jgi:Zn-dependent protease
MDMKCRQCGQETFLPFQCPYCGEYFCSQHRLPENHGCQKIEAARASRQEEVLVVRQPRSYQYSVTFGQPRNLTGKVRFSVKELKHLAVAAVLVMGIGLSLALYPEIFGAADATSLTAVMIYAVVLTMSFFAHEIAHKVTAQKHGLWAEFRLTMWGAVLTLVSVLSPVFKIISPGAMMIGNSPDVKEMGKVSLAGPAVNIFLSAVLFGGALSAVTFAPQLSVVLLLAAFLNGFMAVFNLIPIGILDGFKIFSWNKKIWAAVFAMSVALTIAVYFVMSQNRLV